MMKLLALLLLALAAAGCRRHVVVHEADGDVVVVERGHVHSHVCGHYYHRGRWRVVHNHVHAHGCGHVYRDNVWVFVD